jgi:segregation and condensation protein B
MTIRRTVTMSEAVDLIKEEKVEDTVERVIVFEEALEAVLIAAGHPISYATLARVFEITPGQIKDKVFDYALKYNNSDIPRGVVLLAFKDECQLCTKEHYLTEIRAALGIKKSGTLSTSSLEALAIVAYNQPVTRAFVDTLRRADSSYAMNNLIDRGLIECKGRLDVPGRPMLYGTTSDFLRCFGLENLSKLPTTTEEITAMFERVRNHETEEKADEEIEGGEQMTIAEDILDEVSVTEPDEIAEDTSAIDEAKIEEDLDPSADDYQTIED